MLHGQIYVYWMLLRINFVYDSLQLIDNDGFRSVEGERLSALKIPPKFRHY